MLHIFTLSAPLVSWLGVNLGIKKAVFVSDKCSRIADKEAFARDVAAYVASARSSMAARPPGK